MTADCQTQYQTLSHRLNDGGLSLPEALNCAVELSDALRHIHTEGRAHGQLTLETVVLTDAGLVLLPGEPDQSETVTRYMAPELFQGHARDACSDMFSLGAILYEMFTGRRAFEGETPEELEESISHSTPSPIGHPGLDRLVSTCLAKDRAGRWQRMQQVVMELKLFSTTARRGNAGAVPRHVRIETSLRAEIEQIEVCLASRLEQHEKAIAEQFRAVSEELAQRQAATLHAVTEALGAVRAHVDETESRFSSAHEQAIRAEVAAEAACSEISTLQTAVHGEFQGLRETIKTQALAIESARSATARTDDLVERVVEALEALQSIVLEQSEDQRSAVSR